MENLNYSVLVKSRTFSGIYTHYFPEPGQSLTIILTFFMYPQISLALTLHHLHQRKFSVQQTETKQKITSIKLQNYGAQSQ